MKSQPQSQPKLHGIGKKNALLSIHRSTINPIKPLLKATTNLPARKPVDESGGFIKGYN